MVRNSDYPSGYDDPWGEQQEQESDPWDGTLGTPTAPTAPTSPWTTQQQGYRDTVQNAYEQYLGRTASDAELDQQFGGDYSYNHWQAILNSLPGSQEAQTYASQPQAPEAPTTAPTYTNVMEDTGRLDNPGLTSPKDLFLSTARNYGFDQTAEVLKVLAEKYPQYFAGWSVGSSPDRIIYTGDRSKLDPVWGGVDSFDVIGNYGADNAGWRWGVGEGGGQWHDTSTPTGGFTPPPPSSGGYTPPTYSTTGAGSGSGGSTNTGSTSTSTTTTSTTNPYAPPPGVSNELWALLMGRAKQGLEVGRDDPAVRAQADAYSAQEERARMNYLGDVAESSSPYATGKMAGIERMTAADMGSRVGGFEAQLIGKEIEARRDEIKQALTEMGDLLTDQQKIQLELQIAEMDNAIKRLGLDYQNSQYYAGLSQADRHFLDQMRQRDSEFSADNAYRYSALGQDNNHFLDTLGFNSQKERNYWDWVQRNGE
jgi:hypothetical protein